MHTRGIGVVLAGLLAIAAPALAADTVLADIAERQDEAALRAMLRKKVDVNGAHTDGTTALHWATYHDNQAMAEELLKAGANPNAKNRYGMSPIFSAAENGNSRLVSLLLNAGADVNATLPSGETVLMVAARVGNPDSVRDLLARGADVHRKVKGFGRELQVGGNALLARSQEPAFEFKDEQTAVIFAATEGHAAVLRQLIDAGADFKTSLESGFTPLLFAARQGHIEAAKTLISAGADVNEQTTPKPQWQALTNGYRNQLVTGTTPLHMAVLNAHYDLAVALIAMGANPNAANSKGYTILHTVVGARRVGIGHTNSNRPSPRGSGKMSAIEFVKTLVAKGADVNAKIRRSPKAPAELGTTPLLLATETADLELMQALLDLGADPLVKDENENTMLTVVGRQYGAGTPNEIIEAIQLALDGGVAIDAVNKTGDTAMHHLSSLTFPSVVKFIASKNPTVATWYTKNADGWTPLEIAAGYRPGQAGEYTPSPETEAVVREMLKAAGINPPPTIPPTANANNQQQ